MTYTLLNLAFLVPAAVLAVVAAARSSDRRRFLRALGLTLVVVLILTAIFDNVMIGIGLVAYDPAHLSGIFVGIAPVEDFSYAVFAAVVLPSLWSLLRPSRPSRRRSRAHA
jgi:lycopene cyclase domain-containing protein